MLFLNTTFSLDARLLSLDRMLYLSKFSWCYTCYYPMLAGWKTSTFLLHCQVAISACKTCQVSATYLARRTTLNDHHKADVTDKIDDTVPSKSWYSIYIYNVHCTYVYSLEYLSPWQWPHHRRDKTEWCNYKQRVKCKIKDQIVPNEPPITQTTSRVIWLAPPSGFW
jgi:hypothetical protein